MKKHQFFNLALLFIAVLLVQNSSSRTSAEGQYGGGRTLPTSNDPGTAMAVPQSTDDDYRT